MNCLSTISIRSLLPHWIQSLLPPLHNSSSIWGGEEEEEGGGEGGGRKETESLPEGVTSDTTTPYALTENAAYKMNNKTAPISKRSTALSKHQQSNSEGIHTPTLPSIYGDIRDPRSTYRYDCSGMLSAFHLRYCQSSRHQSIEPVLPFRY